MEQVPKQEQELEIRENKLQELKKFAQENGFEFDEANKRFSQKVETTGGTGVQTMSVEEMERHKESLERARAQADAALRGED